MIHEDPATCAHIDELSFVGVCNKINSDFFYLNGRSSWSSWSYSYIITYM